MQRSVYLRSGAQARPESNPDVEPKGGDWPDDGDGRSAHIPETRAAHWKYTTDTGVASSAWYATNYDDSAWSSGQAGFGTAGTPGAVVRTTWNTSDIWIRQQFTLGALTPSAVSNLVFNCYHDEDCEIYVNGVLGATASGYATTYVLLDMTAAAKSALIPNGVNLIAVHCHQTGGGQNIDVGISQRTLIADTFTVPSDAERILELDETSGSKTADSSGGGNDAALSGSALDAVAVRFTAAWRSTAPAATPASTARSATTSVWRFGSGRRRRAGRGNGGRAKGWWTERCRRHANDFGTALCGSQVCLWHGQPGYHHRFGDQHQ